VGRRCAGRSSALTLALVLALAASGCSGSSDDDDPDGDDARPGGTAVVPVAVDVGDVGTSEEPLRVGLVVSVTSPSGEGQDWLAGAQGARVAEYRLDSGGGAVDLEVVDDSGTANGAATAVEQLVESGVAAIVLATSGSHVQGALESAAAGETPLLLPYYRGDGPLPDNAFRTGPTAAAVDAALLAGLGDQGLERPFVLTADGLRADGVGSADALEYLGRNVEKLARRIAAQRLDGSIDSVVIAAPAAEQAEISSALRGELDDLPVLLTPEATTPSFAAGLDRGAGTIASRFVSAGVDATDTTTMTSTPEADAVAAYFAALRLAAGDPGTSDLFGDASFADAAADADTTSHDAVMAVAAAASAAGSVVAADVLAALDGLEVGTAQGLAGPALDFSDSDALAGEDVVPLLATVQDPGVRPPAAGGGDARLFWFALGPGAG
jgi:hypothetical protein